MRRILCHSWLGSISHPYRAGFLQQHENTLRGHEAELDKLAGEKVTIKGDLRSTNVKVSSVQPAASK
jgi:hypothetical protein